MYRPIIVFTLTILTLAACSKDDSASPPKPLAALKPLPDCQADAPVAISWLSSSKNVFRYTLQLSVQGRDVFYSTERRGHVRSEEITIQRGYQLFVQMSETAANGIQKYASKEFYLPKCDEREAYQKVHRDYEEPVAVILDFK